MCGRVSNDNRDHRCPATQRRLDRSASGLVGQQLRTRLSRIASASEALAASSSDSRATAAVGTAAEVLREAAKSAPPAHAAPSSAELTVALLGRTKAGKSQLVAALTEDLEGNSIGVGRQRTTRQTSKHDLADFVVLDTPGVAALGGERDTRRALKAADAADAVLWLYAESLQDEEAEQLEDLLRRGKPVVVAFNAKWSVDGEGRREAFSRTPQLAFRDLRGHEVRIQQVAARAGTNVPMFVPVHARAAWWAVKSDDARAAAVLRKASRIDDLTTTCHQVLLSRAEALQILRSHDSVRTQLHGFAGAAKLVADLLGTPTFDLQAEFRAESNKLVQSASAASHVAEARIAADIAAVRGALPDWLARVHQESAEEQWNQLLEEHHLHRALDEFAADVAKESARNGALFEATTALRKRFELRRRSAPKPGRGLFGAVVSGMKVVVRATVRVAKSLGVSRGVARLLAKLGGRAIPGAGWGLLATEGLEAISIELRAELKDRQVAVQDWERDARRLYVEELDDLAELLKRRLQEAHVQLVREVRLHYSTAGRVLGEQKRLARDAEQIARAATRAMAQSDRELVEDLATSQGLTVDCRSVTRVPGRSMTIRVGATTEPKPVQLALQPLLLSEDVIVQGQISSTRSRTRR